MFILSTPLFIWTQVPQTPQCVGVEYREGRGEDQARSLINQAADRQDITRGYICRQPRAI